MKGSSGATGHRLSAALAAMAYLAVAGGPAEARQKHRRQGTMPGGTIQGERLTRRPIPYAYSFYPEEIEDGVSGNLPFNNQIRKFKDPLNANGGR